MLRGVADKDAFGRDLEEDPLASMGWADEGTSAQTKTVEVDHAAPPAPHTRTRTIRIGRPRMFRALFSTLVVLAFLGSVAAIAVPRIVDAVGSLEDQLEDGPRVPSGSGGSDEPPPSGLQKTSLVLRGNLAPALRKLEQRSGRGRVRLLRIAPDRIDAQVITADNRLRNLQHRWTGETQMLSDTSAPGSSALPTFGFSDINASAPRRVATRALEGKSSRELSYLVLNDAAGLRWAAFLSSGTGFTARADGRGVKRIGT